MPPSRPCGGRVSTAQWADQAVGTFWRADGSAEVHQGFCELSRPVFRDKFTHQIRNAAFLIFPLTLGGEDAGEDAVDIAIDGSSAPIEGQRRDCPCRIRPDARQLSKPCLSPRPTAPSSNLACAFQEVAGAGVIAKARPRRHDVPVLG